MSERPKPLGDVKNYRNIAIEIAIALAGSGIVLLYLNSTHGKAFLLTYLAPRVAFGLQLFFWGSLGASIASSLFLAKDKEENELESVKPTPDYSVLRYPTEIDVHLYAHRMLTGACLAVVGGLFLYAGLSYFDAPTEPMTTKHKAFFILFAFLVGLYQGNFLAFLNKSFQQMLKKSEADEG